LNFTLLQPSRIIFRSGSVDETGSETSALGRRALLVTGRDALRRSGALDRAQQALARAHVGAVHFDEVEHDPSLATVERATALARREACDVVVGIGGGSVLDTAKAVAIMATQSEPLAHYFAGEEMPHAGVPLVALPTTAGTGAEVTKNAVLTDRVNGVKKSLRSPFMVARTVLVDPELTHSVPPDITAQTGMDALTQAMECYVSNAAQAHSDALSIRAMGLIFRNLATAVKAGLDPVARERMALGSHLAGLAFANAALGAVHGLAHPIGCHFDVPHGLACSVLLPHVLQYNYPSRQQKFGEMAAALGLSSGEAVAPGVRGLLREIGLSDSLRQFGITESDFPEILAQCRSGSMRSNPRPASDDDLVEILRKVV